MDDDHAGTKSESSRWLREAQKRIRSSTSVLIVGGGALGVRKSFQFYIRRRILMSW